ncbi:hypothetical protein H0H87_000745 [Tephrocybe sp. NHM501043]|nr:hypothetical protein H0H87_000745 [Tephrocybe sp. NHM501043]
MPAPVSSSPPARTVNKPSAPKPRGQANKKKRNVRRRGRAPGDIASDDEIEREAATDSESEEDDLSSVGSDSDTDTEPPSEDVVHNGHSRAFTPNTSQSPGDRGVRDKASDQAEPFFSAGGNWSEMVADDERAVETGDLPVIEFAEFDGQTLPARARPKKTKKSRNAHNAPEAPAPPPQVNNDHPAEIDDSQHIASSSRARPFDSPHRLSGQTARQAYQQRLESDPSYVPTVGGFWGHDDRLLDKDLRSLSGWWRDRRGGRGRGRGNTFRGRGRGGTLGGPGNEGYEEDRKGADLPPIERTWGHDGFEEMKQREEQRRAAQNAQNQPHPVGGLRGRGFAGRGGRGGFGRGGFTNTSGRSSANSGRIWYSQKPELSWTKQHEGFLHYEVDPALRPRPGHGPGILIKLPGQEAKVVRTQFRPHIIVKPRIIQHDEQKVYIVNLPERAKSVKEPEIVVSSQETPIEEVFKVRPSLAPKNPNIPLVPSAEIAAPALQAQPSRQSPPHLSDAQIATTSKSEPEPFVRLQLEQLSVEVESSDPARVAKTEEAVMRNPVAETQGAEHIAATSEEPAPGLPAMYSPPLPQPSPSYGSPYGFAPALPPGIAMNQHGMAYELATGRPVYLQAPPPPMYNPRPIVHSHLPPAFVPSHMHSHSHSLSAVSPDFLAHSAPHTPPVNGFIDPSTGTPIFSFPRQTSRIEIRAPVEHPEVKSPNKSQAHSSGLRTSAATFEPSRHNSTNGYYPTLSSPESGSALPSYAPVEGTEGAMDVQHDPMMAYAQYPQQQYYYPEAYGYVHNPYMDMQHVQPYEMYPPHEGAVYY